MSRSGIPAEERFWDNVFPEPNTGCWIWAGCDIGGGYGEIMADGRREKAHRYAYSLLVGTHPGRLSVLHTCDVRCCVNPDHLWLGTRLDNNRDRDEKGRQAKGARNGHARLTRQQVREIFLSDEQSGVLAREYDIHPNHVWKIRSGRRWAHLTRALDTEEGER